MPIPDIEINPTPVSPALPGADSAPIPPPPETYLTNPNFSPQGEPQEIDGNDFTNGTNDISAVGKKTLGQYLSSKTKSKKNFYPISNDSNLDPVVNARGQTLGTISENQSAFSKNSVDLASSGLGVYRKGNNQNQATFFDFVQISTVLDKTGGDKETSGHTLLTEIPEVVGSNGIVVGPPEGEGKAEKILQFIHQQLEQGNLYSSQNGNSFIKLPAGGWSQSLLDESASQNFFSIQRNLGEFDVDAKKVSALDLANRVLEKFKSNINDKNPVISTLLLEDDERSTLSSYYPWRDNPGTLLTFEEWRRDQPFEPGLGAGSSQGTLDYVIQLYLFVLASAIAFKNSAEKLKKNRFVALNDKQATLTTLILNDSGDTSLLTYGKRESRRNWDQKSTSEADRRFTIFDNRFDRCVIEGAKIFFGIDSSTEPESIISVADASSVALSEQVKKSVGFYQSILKSISYKSTENTSFGKSKKFWELPTREKKDEHFQKLESFVLTIGALGDIAIKSKRGMRDVTPGERLLTKEASAFVSPSILAAPMVIAADGEKSSQIWSAVGGALLGTFRKHVSRWSPIGSYDAAPSANALSLHTFFASQKNVPGVGQASTTPIGMRSLFASRDTVELIENALEAEYMPFYVHDLRTHEIISMPAFITEFSETFTPSYESLTGFGRQDPVRIYKSTERTVTIGFKLVAYNEEDFDHLWLTVNKFVSMCYPQYSAGRVRKGGAGENSVSFVQPFSQVPAASPMIRLRLGDVFKSNYSKFGLARLFGLNSSAFEAKNAAESTAEESDPGAAASKASKEFNAKIAKLGSISENKKKAVVLAGVKAAGTALGVANAKTDGLGSIASNVLYDEGSPSQAVTNYLSNDQANDLRTVVKLGIDTTLNSPTSEFATEFDKGKTGLLTNKDFYDSNNNSIVRSFESTRGRGVAGFITSLALSYEGANWETKFGKKAPKMVTIAMGFTPVTDLPLGLDYDGYMRNPSHPVGRFAGSFGDVYDEFSKKFDKTVSPPDFNRSTLQRKLFGGQAAADLLLDGVMAASDAAKDNEPGGR